MNFYINFAIFVFVIGQLCEITIAKKPDCPPVSLTWEEMFFIDDEDCSKYYQCANGNARTINCPPTLIYNPKIFVSILLYDVFIFLQYIYYLFLAM